MDDVDAIDAVMEQDLFDGVPYQQISRLVDAASRRRLKAKAVLCESLTVDDHLFVLLEGRLRLESHDRVKLDEFEPVRIIGEMGVLTGQARTSRVIAEESCEVLAISREDLEELVDEDDDLCTRLLANLCKLLYGRVHEMNGDIEGLRRQATRLRARLQELSPADPLLTEAPR